MSRKLQFLTGISILSLVLAISLSIIALSPANAAPGDFDLDGRDLIMDADGDTVIDANSDDLIQFTVGGTPLPDNFSGSSVITKNLHLTSNETRVSTTTLANSALQISAQANKLYFIEITFIWANGGSVTNGKIGFLVPSGATFDAVGCSDVFGGGGGAYCSKLNEASSSVLGSDATIKAFTVTGILNTAGSSGTFALQWAQDTSSGTAHTMYADSYMNWTIYDG